MKKIMIVGLILAMTACSKEPEINMDDLARDILFENIKGSYVEIQPNTLMILQQSGENFEQVGTVDKTTTINSLDFIMPADLIDTEIDTEIKFEYIEVLDNAWLVYKVTYDTTVRYTALATSTVEGGGKAIVIESFNLDTIKIKFRENKADIDPQKFLGQYLGTIFLLSPSTKTTQDQSITGTVVSISDL